MAFISAMEQMLLKLKPVLVSSKISHRKASYNRQCAGQKDTKATNSDHHRNTSLPWNNTAEAITGQNQSHTQSHASWL